MTHQSNPTDLSNGSRPSAADLNVATASPFSHWYVVQDSDARCDMKRMARTAEEQDAVMRSTPSLETVSQRRIGLIAKYHDDLLGACSVGRQLGLEVLVSDNMIKGLYDVLKNREDWEAIFFRFEDFGTITSLFNFISAFRLRCPSVPIVLVSDEFRRNDFGPERLALCDASITLPTEPAIIAAAILAAKENNAIWVERVQENRRDPRTN